MPAAGRGFTSCGRACICPHRPSPGSPPYWSSPHHSCCDTPEEATQWKSDALTIMANTSGRPGEMLTGKREKKEKMGYFWISNSFPTDCWLNPCPADQLPKCSCGTTRRHGTNISSSGFSTSCNYLHAWLTNLIRTAVSTSSISVKYFPSVWMLVLDAIRV